MKNKSKVIVLFILLCFVNNHLFANNDKDTLTFNVANVAFGAIPNDGKDDVPGIQKAIDSARIWLSHNAGKSVAKIYFPEGVYLVKSYTRNPRGYWTNYAVSIYSGIILEGAGNKASVIKVADHLFDSLNVKDPCANANIFYGVKITDVAFRNLTIDMNGINNLVPSRMFCDTVKNEIAIKVDGGSNLHIENITIKNSAGRNHISVNGNGNGFTVKQSSFINGGWCVGSPKISNLNNTDFSFLYSEWDNSIFELDTIIQQYPDIALQWYTGGIEIHGSNSHVLNVLIQGCNPGVYIASEKADRSKFVLENTSVQNSVMTSCTKGVEFFIDNVVNNCKLINNFIQLTSPRGFKLAKEAYAYRSCGIRIPNGNLPCYTDYTGPKQGKANKNMLSNIVIRDNTITSDIPDTSHFYASVGIIVHSLHNSSIEDNRISGMNYAGIQLQGSPWGMKNVLISKNTIDSFRHYYDPRAVAGYIIATDTYYPNSDCSKKNTSFQNIAIRDNIFISGDTDASEAKACGNKEKKVACFKGMFFALPAWYGYESNKAPYTMRKAVFQFRENVFKNTSVQHSMHYVVQGCGKPCVD